MAFDFSQLKYTSVRSISNTFRDIFLNYARISSRFPESALYTNRYVDEKCTDEKPIRRLIELQRRLLQSKSPFARRIGTLLAAGALDRHLAELTDKQIGQLLRDDVGKDLGILQPEATICNQATRRLFRSELGSLEDELPLRPPCPVCGNDMLFHYGVDAPDFFECSSLRCEHKEYAPYDGKEERGKKEQ